EPEARTSRIQIQQGVACPGGIDPHTEGLGRRRQSEVDVGPQGAARQLGGFFDDLVQIQDPAFLLRFTAEGQELVGDAARLTCSAQCRRFESSGVWSRTRLTLPRMACSRLLKSCATPGGERADD